MNVWNGKNEFLMESLIGQLGLNHIFFWSNLLQKLENARQIDKKKKSFQRQYESDYVVSDSIS